MSQLFQLKQKDSDGEEQHPMKTNPALDNFNSHTKTKENFQSDVCA